MFCRDCERHIDDAGRPFVGGRCPACDREERRREQQEAQQAKQPVGEVQVREDFFSRDRRRRIQNGVDEAGRAFTRFAWIDGSDRRPAGDVGYRDHNSFVGGPGNSHGQFCRWQKQ